MHIVITTGIFEPEAGGPATYAPKIATKFVEAGHKVSVITYSDKESYDFDAKYPFRLIRVVRGDNKFSNYLSFFRVVLRELKDKDIAYSLDWVAAGLPLVVAAMFRNVPVVIRVGGDYIWETYLRALGAPMPLTEFYEKGLHKNFALLFRIILFVLGRAFVIFNSDVQRTMYQKYYRLRHERTAVIHNPMPEKDWLGVRRDKSNDEIVFAGRFIAMKNITLLLAAFAKTRIPFKLVLIGDGPEEHRVRNAVQELRLNERVSIMGAMRQEELYERVRNSRALILPSWTDIAPNEVNEAVALGIPIIVTKENYLPYRAELPEMLDPASIDDIVSKLEMLADEERYIRFVEQFRRVTYKNSWDDVLRQHLSIFERTLSRKR